jgi:hypothetical protein
LIGACFVARRRIRLDSSGDDDFKTGRAGRDEFAA